MLIVSCVLFYVCVVFLYIVDALLSSAVALSYRKASVTWTVKAISSSNCGWATRSKTDMTAFGTTINMNLITPAKKVSVHINMLNLLLVISNPLSFV